MNMHSPVKRGPRRAKAAPESGMRYRTGLVTPEEAAVFILNMDAGDTDTKAYRVKVSGFAEVMREDRWDPNGETVVLGASGKVLDGRARLLACVEANKPFPVILVTGVDDAAYITIDTHSRRSTVDVLAINETGHARVVSSACQAIASYLNAPDRERWRYQGSTAVGTVEIALMAEAFSEDLAISADLVVGLKTGKLVPNTVATACHFLASKADPDLANAFFRELAEAGKGGRSAPAILRRRYASEESNTTFTYRMAVFSKAWAAYLDKRFPDYEEIDYRGPVERKGAVGKETFPPIRGIDPGLRIDFERLQAGSAAKAARSGSRGLSAYNGVTVREVFVTLDMCHEYLAKNGPRGRNRSVREGHVRDLARMIREDKWHPNGKTIKRTAAGDLIDGQHRCRAGIAAGKGFVSLVVEGLDPACFATLDLGERRSLGRHLKARGLTTGKQVNSICTTFWRLSKNLTGGEPTAIEAESLYRYDKEGIDRSIAFVKVGQMHKTLDISIAGALHRTFSLYDAPLADAFMRTIATGYDLRPGNAIHKLREELNYKHGLLNTHVRKVRAVIRTWNAVVTGQGARELQLVVEGESGYPEPQYPTALAPAPADIAKTPPRRRKAALPAAA